MSRVLVVKLSSLGDLFHVLPAVHAIRRGLGSPVDWVTQPEYVALVRCFTDVDRVISFPRREWLRKQRNFLRELREEIYDLVVDFQGLLKSAWVARLARSKRVVGPASAREGARWLYTDALGPRDRSVHAVEEAAGIARDLGLEVDLNVFPVQFPEIPCELPKPCIGLVPRSRWPTKNWPPDFFAETVKRLHSARNPSFVVFGSNADRPVGELIAAAAPGVLNLCGQTTLPELGGWMRCMDLVISVDSGPMHVAAAVGRPVLALFGPTDPRRTAPWGSQHRVLVAPNCECRPCDDPVCPRDDLACLRLISPEQVANEALGLLG